MPWLSVEDICFYGFRNAARELEQIVAIGECSVPADLPISHFRLAKDYVTRFLYPHMRPDLSPPGLTLKNCGGFHGQHKETLAEYGGVDPETLRRVFKPRPDEVIIDAGCFIGMGDIHMSRLLPDGHIYAVEADARCYSLLHKNLEYNRIGNVTPFHRAMWNKDTVIQMESGPAQANTLIPEIRVGEEKQQVRTISIDQMVREQRITRLDMISLTLNGAEMESLEGARDTLRRLRPRIKLPGWYTRNGVPIHRIAREFLEGMEYRVFSTPRGNILAVHSKRMMEKK